ncbi:MAG: hypothetical protein GXP54_03465 [Deltaproteobacteria bacterium]|nr:hypothetical protein [Deltaproteobacteria bacterium]
METKSTGFQRASALLICCAAVCLCASTAHALDPPHDWTNGIDCGSCHASHGFLIPRGEAQETMCKSCHNPTGTASMLSDVANHVVNGGQTVVDCGSCHAPHGPRTSNDSHPGGKTDYNLRLIRDDIAKYVPGALEPALFQQRPQQFAFGDDDPPWNGICQACHTLTNHHTRDGSADHEHNLGVNCTSCHTHKSGFMASGGCMDCHSVPQGPRRQIVEAGGDFARTSHHVFSGVVDADCTACHDMGAHQSGTVRLKDPDAGAGLIYEYDPAEPSGIEAFCLNCHDGDGALAGGGLQPFSDGLAPPNVKGVSGSLWKDSSHARTAWSGNGGKPISCLGDGSGTGCHSNAHGSDNVKLLALGGGVSLQTLCFNCHSEGKVMNDALSNNLPGGYVSADDIQEAFNKSRKHVLGAAFTVGGSTYSLQCTSCHNPHVVTGKHWDAGQGVSPVTRPNLSADPAVNPRAMGTSLWGAAPGQKMNDFAAQGAGTGGWYYSTARGDQIAWDQPAAYQPPRAGNGYSFEMGGDVLPDYTTLCLDCHSHRMSPANPPVNWGQGIGCTDNGVDPPDQRIECGAQHGLNPAGRPYYVSDKGKAGFWASGGNPDALFRMNYVTRGRGVGHFMRWPYETADRNAGINFVLACTDCHEAHGSNRGGMVRERLNVTENGDCGSGGVGNPGENCSDGGNWNSFCNTCHYYYGGQHAGMSCGNASCHEANSPHRIIHTTDSGASTWLHLTASGYEDKYLAPTFTPEILTVDGLPGSADLVVRFMKGVYSSPDLTGGLGPDDFWLFDKGGDNPRKILDVTHVPGEDLAIITMSAALTASDIDEDTIAARPAAIWAWYDGWYQNWDTSNPPIGEEPVSAGPWPATIGLKCPDDTTFEFNEPAGSATVSDSTGTVVGTVGDPSGAIPGDGYYHGDLPDNYVYFTDNPRCFKATTSMTLDVRVFPFVTDDGAGSTIQRVFARDDNQNYQMTIWRSTAAAWTPTFHPPQGVASIALWLSPVDKHGGKWWKPVLTDYDRCPIVKDHWYLIRFVWNSAKVGGMPGDFFIDDQGTDGADSGEGWAGFINCTDEDMSQNPADRRLFEGDEITPGNGNLAVGANVKKLPAQNKNKFEGLIDWIRWRGTVDYSGLDDTPNPPQP